MLLSTTVASSNREAWLNEAYKAIKPIFKVNGINLPAVHISVGWPSGGMRSSTIGETFAKVHSPDKKNHIYISPRMKDPVEILSVLVHEACHVADDCKSSHGKEFQKIARSVGLIAPWTSTQASVELQADLRALKSKLGRYPHPGYSDGSASSEPPQKTYMLKLVCKQDGYLVRTTQTWVDAGLPGCGICGAEMEVDN